MTEDTSPENLRKFLESDDPALVMMGLSMAKGIDCPVEIKYDIIKIWLLGGYLSTGYGGGNRLTVPNLAYSDSNIRNSARTLFTDKDYAMTLENIIINDKIKIGLREAAIFALSELKEENEELFLKIFKTEKKTLRKAAVSALLKNEPPRWLPFTKRYQIETTWEDLGRELYFAKLNKYEKDIAKQARHICTDYAMKTLIDGLNEKSMTKTIIVQLGNNKDKRIVEPFINLFKKKGTSDSNKTLIILALNNFTDEKITKLLANSLNEKGHTLCTKVESALRNIDASQYQKRNELLIKNLQSTNIFAREISAKILRKAGYLKALNPLKKAYSKYYDKKTIEYYKKKPNYYYSMHLANRILGEKYTPDEEEKMRKEEEEYQKKAKERAQKEKELKVFGNIKKAINELEIRARGWEFESTSQKGTFYSVTKKENILVCNCKGFFYNSICTHIKQVIEMNNKK